jgi:putative inorganic carbon (HCO3(-)) transporter
MVFVLFLTALFGFVTGQVFRIGLSDGLVIQLTDLLVFLAVAAWTIRELYHKRLRHHFNHPYTRPIVLFLSIGLLSLLVNLTWLSWTQMFISSLYLIRWGNYALVFYEVKSFPKEKRKKIIHALLISSVLLIFAGYLQYFFYPNLKVLYHLGWDDHLYRMFSTLLDPNFAAATFSLICLLALSYLFSRKRIFDRSFFGAAVLFLFSFIALLLTYSRGGFLTFAAGCMVLFVLLKKRVYLFCFLTLLLLGIFLLPKNLHSAGVELWRTASIFARTEAAQQALHIFADHPILGVGFDSFRYAQKHYHYAAGNNWEVSHSGGGTDNSLVFVLATAGLVGFISYLYLWSTILMRSYSAYKIGTVMTWDKTLTLVILSSIGALFVNSFFINSLFYTQIIFWIWILLGLVEKE